MTAVPGAREVREEDAFDVAAVRRWLAGQGVELAEDVEVRQFEGGASNLTFSLRDGTHDLVLRKPPAGRKAKGAHDMGREYRIQAALAPVFPYVPRMIAYAAADDSPIGSELYVMERVDGVIPRKEFQKNAPVPSTYSLLAFSSANAIRLSNFADDVVGLMRCAPSAPPPSARP